MRIIPKINDTTRKLASIQRINLIEPCQNSENLEIASVLGWKVVVQKGEFHVGEKAIYFEIDSFIPLTPEVEFLRKYSYKKHQDTGADGLRIKTIRLRGTVSQGLLLPISTFFKEDIPEGIDVTEKLGVTKYEVIESISIDAKGTFPKFLHKTDEVRIQTIPSYLEKYKGTSCYITEKIDGQSCTAYFKDDEFGVCSRNLDLKLSDENLHCIGVKQQDTERILRELGMNIALHGELFGSGGGHLIQKNRLKATGLHWAIYSVYLIDEDRFMDFEEMETFLNNLHLPMVPVIQRDAIINWSVDDLVKLATRKSIINPEIWAEGIVIRPLKNIKDQEFAYVQGTNGTGLFSFKVLNPEYLIKYEE